MQTLLENIFTNPFVNTFADCLDNLPQSIQYLLSELRDLDCQVNELHREILNFKENHQFKEISDEKLNEFHALLLKCDELSERKVYVCTQLTQILDLKAKQLLSDKQSLSLNMFEIEILDEEKVIGDFKRLIKSNKTRANLMATTSKPQLTHNTQQHQLVTKAMAKYVDTQKTTHVNNNQKYRLITSKSKVHETLTSTSSGVRKQVANYQLPERKAKKSRLDEMTSIKSTTTTTTTLNFRSKRFKSSTTITKSSAPSMLTLNSTASSSSISNNTNKKRNTHNSSPSSQGSSSLSSFDENNKLILNEDNNTNDSLTSGSHQTHSCTTANVHPKMNTHASTNSTGVNGDGNEPVYCTCQQISYGQMIGCDNVDCKLEWFHFSCVNLTSKPKGKWYCPQCRGDSHKVMKKPHGITARLL